MDLTVYNRYICLNQFIFNEKIIILQYLIKKYGHVIIWDLFVNDYRIYVVIELFT